MPIDRNPAPGIAPDEPTPPQQLLKRQSLLDAAAGVFLEHGFGGASMDLIAVAANVSRRTLFNQFESKEALFAAAVTRVWERMPVIEIANDGAALSDPALGLFNMGMAIADFWAPDASLSLLRMVISEGSRFPQLARDFMALGKTPALQALIAYLARLQEKGHLRVEDPDLAARQFVGLVNEPLLWPRLIVVAPGPSMARRTEVVQQAVKLFLTCYAVHRH